jgi:hypothetical protein
LKDVTILEEVIEPAAVALKFCASIEYFSKGILDHSNFFADAEFTAELFLNVGGR